MAARIFIGRVAELHQLEANFRAARTDELRLVVLAGEAGIGKTRLLNEFLDRVEDARVLTGACLPLESAPLPYAPIVDALRGLLHAIAPDELAELLGGARPDLARLLPELGADPSVPEPTGSHREARARLFEQLLGVIERAGVRQPLVVAVEDIHWADAETRDLLRFIVRGLRRASVLMVLTVRTDDVGRGGAGTSLAAELGRLASATRVNVPRLDEAEVGELATALLGERPSSTMARRLADRSDGIPFAVEQLIDARDRDGNLPPTLTDTISAGLAGLSAAGRIIVGVAAACGRRVDETLVAAVSGMTFERVEQGVAEAVRARILVPVTVGGVARYEFRHALIREAIDRSLLLSDRKRLHLAAAAALDEWARSGERPVTESVASELANHWEAAEEWDRALAAHLGAATEAERIYAWGAAAVHCEQALAIAEDHPASLAAVGTDRAELVHRVAEAAYRTGDYDTAITRGREAIELVAADPARAGALHERLRWYLWDAGDRKGAIESVSEALRLIPATPASHALASVVGQLAAIEMHTGQPAEAAATAERALAMAREIDSSVDIGQALGVLGWIQVVNGEVDAGMATLDEALKAATAAHDFAGTALGSALIAQMHWWLGQETAARDVALAGYERIADIGLLHAYGGVLLGHAARAQIALGEWDAADEAIATGLEHERLGRPAPLSNVDGSAPSGRTGMGRRRGPLKRGVETAGGPASTGRHAWLRINRARLLTARAAWPEAMEDLLEARAFEVVHGPTEYAVDLLAAEAELAAWRGDVAAARAAADALAVTPPTAPFGPAHARAAAFALMAEADEAERARAVSNARRQLEARDRAARLAGLIRATLPPTSHLLAAPAWVAMVGWINAEAARAEGTATAPAWAEVGKAWEDAGHRLDAAYAWYRHGHLVAATANPRIASHDPFEWTRAVADHLGARALSERIPGADRLSGDASSPDLAGAPALQPDPIGDEVTRITVHALGRMRVERDGQPIRHLGGLKAGRRQAEAIFAFLLDRGAKGATKEEMVDLIWEEIDLAAADLAFHRTMGGLRRALQPAAPSRGRSAIRFDHDRYVLDPSIVTWTDVAAFNAAVDEAFASPDPFAKAMALEEARRLYRGDYFDDCPYFGDSADVEPTRTRLRGRYVDVLVMLGELAEERGDVRGAELLYREALDMAEDRAGAAADGLARVGAVRTELRVVSSR